MAAGDKESEMPGAGEYLNLEPQLTKCRREVCTADVAAIRRLVESTGFFYVNEVEIAVELVEERLAQGPASGYEFFLLDDACGLAGYACYGEIPARPGDVDLYWIVVRPDLQGCGIGRMLLQEVVAAARALGAKRLYAETSGQALYEPTRSFYCRRGFELIKVVADHYAPGDDMFVYELKID
jgi:GNAT superfamily N-acetyltransferase